MNACREWKEQLLELAAEPLDAGSGRAADIRQLDAHLQVCAGCASALADYRASSARMSSAFPALAEGAAPREGFDARVFARIAAQRESGPLASYVAVQRKIWRMRLVAAGAICALVIAAFAWPSVKRLWRTNDTPVVSITAWQSPTDSLLRTPGQKLLQSGPKVGDFYFSLQQVSKKEKK